MKTGSISSLLIKGGHVIDPAAKIDEPMDILLEGITQHRTLEMLYDSRSSGTWERRRIDPYHLNLRDGRYFELHAWCQGQLARFKQPKTIDFVVELPRDPNGKLYKRKLRDPYWEGQERAI